MRILLIFAGRDGALASTLCRGAGRRSGRQREPPHAQRPGFSGATPRCVGARQLIAWEGARPAESNQPARVLRCASCALAQFPSIFYTPHPNQESKRKAARRRCSAGVLSRRHRAASQSHFQRWLPAWFSWPFWSATAAPCSSAPAPRGTPWRKTPWHAVPRLSKWIYPRSYATTPWRPSWYHQLPVLLWGCWSLVRFLPPLWFGGRRLSSKRNQVLKSFWCALTPAAPLCSTHTCTSRIG